MIDFEYRKMFNQDSVHKNFIIQSEDGSVSLSNSNLYSESFELTESLCSDTDLVIGSCEASCIKFKITNSVSKLLNKKLNVKIELNNDADTPFIIGKYKVQSDKPSADRNYRDVVAYDAMYDIINAEVSNWYNSLTFPLTLKEFRDSFFKYMGIDHKEISLVNDGMRVEETIKPSELSGGRVVTAICELNGCFGHIGRDGVFKYIFLQNTDIESYPAEALYPSENFFPESWKSEEIGKSGVYRSANYEDYDVKPLTKLQIRKEERDIGAISGTGDNCYIVEDNFLVYGKSAADLSVIADNLFSVISKVSTYTPCEIKLNGNPCIEVGDSVLLNTRNKSIETYVMQRTLSGIQVLTDEYKATGNEVRKEKVNSTNKQIIQLRGKTNVLERNVEETKLEIKDVEQNLSTKIEQTADSITAEVSRAQDQEEKLAASIKLNADNILLKVSKGNVSSEISQEAGSVSIKSDRFSLESSNLTIDKKGNITSSNGTFTAAEISSNFTQNSDGWATSGLKVQRDGTLKTQYISVGSGGVSTNGGVSANGNISSLDGSITAAHTVSGNLLYAGDGGIATSGKKSRVVSTNDYGRKELYCYEMAVPFFGDIGRGETDENGICIIFLDDIFFETVDANKCAYQVFITPYSDSHFFVKERNPKYFVVKGNPYAEFTWEVKAMQKGYEYDRLETYDRPEEEIDILSEIATYVETIVLSEELEQASNEIEEVIKL